MCSGVPSLREFIGKKSEGPARDVVKYKMGDSVWKRESKYDGKGFAPVFAPRWSGPFIVHAVWDRNAYKLRTDPTVTGKQTGFLSHPMNGSRLRPFVEGDL